MIFLYNYTRVFLAILLRNNKPRLTFKKAKAMEKIHEDAIKSLIQLREINSVRVKGYQNAIDVIRNGELKNYFQVKIKEIVDFSECINRSIDSTSYDVKEPVRIDGEKIHQSQFYFTMAMSSNNPRTVALSCQLGDKFAAKAYEATLSLVEFLSFPDLTGMLMKHISNLRKSFNTTQQTFDMAFV